MFKWLIYWEDDVKHNNWNKKSMFYIIEIDSNKSIGKLEQDGIRSNERGKNFGLYIIYYKFLCK